MQRFKKIMIGSKNVNKEIEIRDKLKHLGITFIPNNIYSEVPEPYTEFHLNAKAKALFYSNFTKHPVLSDDSGIVVPHLTGVYKDHFKIDLPGILSSRFSELGLRYDLEGSLIVEEQPKCSLSDRPAKNRRRLLGMLTDTAGISRRAYYSCALVIAQQGKVLWEAENTLHGFISFKEQGNNGFGYDPIFIPITELKTDFYPKNNFRTLADYSLEEKQKISHRAQALERFIEWMVGR
jgi:XTP/dITP diphosphohydrolase